MKNILYLLPVLIWSCQSRVEQNDTTDPMDTVSVGKEPVAPPSEVYANTRFADVVIQKTGEHTYQVSGKAQIFEATISWVVEDGHYELLKGFETADAGAPEWGNFSFSITVQKQRENSTLHLILFESSAMDGSRQHELPIMLE
jgi:hypothetical protein